MLLRRWYRGLSRGSCGNFLWTMSKVGDAHCYHNLAQTFVQGIIYMSVFKHATLQHTAWFFEWSRPKMFYVLRMTNSLPKKWEWSYVTAWCEVLLQISLFLVGNLPSSTHRTFGGGALYNLCQSYNSKNKLYWRACVLLKDFSMVFIFCKVDSILTSSNVKCIPMERYLTLSKVASYSFDLTAHLAHCPSEHGSLTSRNYIG